MTPTQEQIEAASFDAYEIQKLAFAKHGVKLDNPLYEDMYTAGFEAGAKMILEQREAQKDQWQREAWFAAVTPTCDCGEADCPWEEWDRNKYDNWQKMQKANLRKRAKESTIKT